MPGHLSITAHDSPRTVPFESCLTSTSFPRSADEVVSDAAGNGLFAQPVMQFKYGVPGSIMVPCIGGASRPILTFSPGVTVPCINGASLYRFSGRPPSLRILFGRRRRCAAAAATDFFSSLLGCLSAGFQNFTGYQYPGLITRHPTGSEDTSVAGAWQV